MDLNDFLVNWRREIADDRYQTQCHNKRDPSKDASKSIAHEDGHQIAGTKRCEEKEHEDVCKLPRTLAADECSALFVLPGSEKMREQDSSVQWVLCRPPRHADIDVGGACKNKEDERCQTDCLVDTLIADLDEINTIPFFDVQLPHEIAVVIFSYLSIQDLCYCSMVSKSWQVLADDNVLWCRQCHKMGHHLDLTVDQLPCWKTAVQELIVWKRRVRQNWMERICDTVSYQPDNEGCICTAVYGNRQFLACYSSGECYIWDLRQKRLREGPTRLRQTSPVLHRAPSAVTAVTGDLALVGTDHGVLKVFDTVQGVEVYHHKDLDHISALAAASGSSVTSAVVSSGRLHSSLTLLTAHSSAPSAWECCRLQLPSPAELRSFKVLQVDLVHCDKERLQDQFLVLYSTQTSLTLQNSSSPYSKATHFLAAPGKDGVCCVNCFRRWENHLACGTYVWTYSVKMFDLTNGTHYSSLHGHTAAIRCIQFHSEGSSTPRLVTGSEDKRVHVYDTRQQKPCLRLIGHGSAVQCVQMDQWKVVSGGRDGMVIMWDQRMGRQLWHTRERHPVQVCHFEENDLVIAHVPTYKPVESLTNSPHTLHIRERGMVRLLDFSANPLNSHLPSICSSVYDEPSASFFNLDLKYPYDSIL